MKKNLLLPILNDLIRSLDSKNFKKCFSAFLLIFIGYTNLNAQVANYIYSEAGSGTYTPISGTSLFGANPDNQETAVGSEIPLGFTFNFNGTNYTNIRVCANGYLVFGGTNVLSAQPYTPISGTLNYAGAVSGYGKDLVYASQGTTPIYTAVAYPSSVEYLVSGTAGSRTFTLQFKNMARYKDLVSPYEGILNFQIKLYEGSNIVEVVHNAQAVLPTTPTTNVIGQVGLRGTAATDFKTRASPTIPSGFATNYTFTNAGGNATAGLNYRVNSNLGTVLTMTWTPQCYAPTAPTVGTVTATSAVLSWTAPTIPPGNYQYEIRTSGAAGSGSTGLALTNIVGASPTTASGLPEGTTYTWYLRSYCGVGFYGTWVTGPSFTTSCSAKNIPYTRNFDEGDVTIPAIPPCNSIQNMGSGNNWGSSAVSAASTTGQFLNNHLLYDSTVGVGGTQAANVWFYTAGLNLTAGQTYKLSYKYGGSTESPSITNKMIIKFGTSATDAGMTTTLADHNNIKASPNQNNISFVAPSTGVYYIGFKAYSDMNQGRLFLDDISVTQPACVSPTALTIANITSNSAASSWTAPASAPGSGYAYYLTTSANIAATAMVAGTKYQIYSVGTTDYTFYGAASNTIGTIFTATAAGTGTGVVSVVPADPIYDQTATGFTAAGTNYVALTGLTGSTVYYLWVRSNCGLNDFSPWSAVRTFTTLVQPTYCTISSAATGSRITNFTTTGGVANISNSSGFSSGGYGNFTAQFVSQVPNSSVNFSITNNDTLGGAGIGIWVDWSGDGIFQAGEQVFNSSGYVYGGPATGTITVPLGQALGDYRMRIIDDYWSTSPSNPCAFSTTSPPTRGEAEDYTFRVLTPPPALALNINTSTQCAGTNSPLVTITPATVGNYTVYTWSPSTGVTGNSASGYTFNSATSINYTLTGFKPATFETNTVSFNYVATQLPTPITITPASSAICQDVATAVLLTASGGVVPNEIRLSENFNTSSLGNVPPTGWTSTNTGSGTVANGDFTIRPNSYDPPTWTNAINSNDSSQFIFTDGDSQGYYATNSTTLVSPVFSLGTVLGVSLTSASLSFWHFHVPYSESFVGVELSTDGGLSWPTTLQAFTGLTNGTRNNFENVIINLNPYIGQTNLKIRFRYNAVWGYGWAIDNVVVSGTSASTITWTPSGPGSGLYIDAAHTTEYTAGTKTNTVYALPNSTQTYTATAATASPVCTTTQTVTITVTPIAAGVASSNQSICGGAPAPLTLTGSSGTIQWWYADNLAFSSGVTLIAGANSATLSSAQMGGVLAANRYFRATITNGSCSSNSNIVSILTNNSSTTWNGSAWSNGNPSPTKAVVFNGPYSSDPLINLVTPGDISACSVTVTALGSVNFIAGTTLTVEKAIDNTAGGTMTFEDGSSLYQPNAVTNAVGVYSGGNLGNITYKRTASPMYKFDYTYWSSPVYPQNLFSFSPLTPLFYQYDGIVANQWQNITSTASSTNMAAGKGYLIRAPNNFPVYVTPLTPLPGDYAGSFVGVPNNGTISVQVGASLGINQFNLLGNPYPSALFADNFITANPNVGALYFWTHNTNINATTLQYTNDDYAVYTLAGGVGTMPSGVNGAGQNNTPNGYISSGQGFFTKGAATITGTAPFFTNFTNAMRRANNNGQYFKTNSGATNSTSTNELEKHRYWLDIANTEGAFKEALIAYIETATMGIDRLFEGEMVDNGNVISLYTTVDSKKMTIQGRPLPFDINDTVPLGYKSTIASTYTISLPRRDGLFDTQHVYLEDKLLNVIHDLTNSSYTFATEIGTFENRFVLRYTTEALGIDNPVFNENSVVVYKNQQGLFINSGAEIMRTVTIYDIRGRLLSIKKQIGGTTTVFTNLPTTQQVLLVKIEGENGGVVTKKVVY